MSIRSLITSPQPVFFPDRTVALSGEQKLDTQARGCWGPSVLPSSVPTVPLPTPESSTAVSLLPSLSPKSTLVSHKPSPGGSLRGPLRWAGRGVSAALCAAPRAVASLPGHPWLLCLFLKQDNCVTEQVGSFGSSVSAAASVLQRGVGQASGTRLGSQGPVTARSGRPPPCL